MSELVWSAHALQRARQRFPGIDLDADFLTAKRAGVAVRKRIRKNSPFFAANHLSRGFPMHFVSELAVYAVGHGNVVVTVYPRSWLLMPRQHSDGAKA